MLKDKRIRIKWMNRQAMVLLGVQVLKDNWQNRLETGAVSVWFDNNAHSYASFQIDASKDGSDNQKHYDGIRRRFWKDVERLLESGAIN